ncbi:MAG: FAD-binding oxidoreductase, partial [Chloroflexi bacterium]|nr:FAD-binding oxidoreductase [Chloroflexota bacterium]
VIVAAGAWSSRLLWPLGLRLPQRKVRATVLATTPAPALSPVVVWTDDVAMRQGPDGRFILAGGGRSHYDVDLELARFAPRFARSLFDARRRGRIRLHLGRTALRDLRTLLPEPVGEPLWPQVRAEEPEPDVDAAWRTFRRFRELVPQAADVGVDRIWAGYIDYTPDAVPIIDAPGTPRGLVIATGFSGHGFALGPVGGLLASQLATDEPTAVDVRSFRLSRFDEGDTAEDVLHF